MFGKVVKGDLAEIFKEEDRKLQAIAKEEVKEGDGENPSSKNSSVIETWTKGFIESPFIQYGEIDTKKVEENWVEELRLNGSPTVIALFNFDRQAKQNSLMLKNNSPVSQFKNLSLTPYCLDSESAASKYPKVFSGVEQLDTTDENFMVFDNFSGRYSLDMRNILNTMLKGDKQDQTTETESVLLFGWVETYKDLNFVEQKKMSGSRAFDYFTISAAKEEDESCEEFQSQKKIAQLRHLVEIVDNQVVSTKIELSFFGTNNFPRRDNYILREEIGEGSYSYTLRMKIDRKAQTIQFNFKDGFGKEVQYSSTREQFLMTKNPIIYIGNTDGNLNEPSSKDQFEYAIYKYRYRTLGLVKGITNHDVCVGVNEFNEHPTDLAMNYLPATENGDFDAVLAKPDLQEPKPEFSLSCKVNNKIF